MSEKLSLLDDSSDSEVELIVNKSYAKSYNQWRNKEELQKYKDLKKDEDDSESSSESEEEIPEFDEEFFRALSLLKAKDPRIYDKNFELFKNKEMVKKPKTPKEKPVYMKDYERSLVLERGGKFSDEEDEDIIPEKVPTYDEEQEKLKKSFKEALGNSDDSDGDADDLLQVRTKTKKEEDAEEADFVKWLKGEEKEVSEDVKKDLSYLRNYWNDPKLDEEDKFLRDYILNKRYLEKDDSEIPTYEELTSGALSDDEKMLKEQETFEHKYNFRFEEPDEEFIKRYPRTIGDSLRRTDNRRKQKREEKAERQRKEKEQRREELKRLKALKRKEIEEKFMKLKEISGQDEINLNESDIESDFDPDKHDQKMSEMFNDDYYQVEEDMKPEFPYDEELDSENWNAWAGEKIVDDEDDDDDENDNTKEENWEYSQGKPNFKEEFANEMIDSSRPKKKVKKKSLFAKIISQSKPIYDPDGKSFEEYLDEYYKLDYEDVVGDMPVRYKYRKVIPNDFGLTVDEILAADDRELNRWCSVKKTCQYRRDDEELYEVQAYRKKAQIPAIKKKFLPSVYAPKETDDFVANSDSLNHLENSAGKTEGESSNPDSNDIENATKKPEREESNLLCSENNSTVQAGEEQDSNSQNHKKKSKKKKRKGNKNASVLEEECESTHFIEGNDVTTVEMDCDSSNVIDMSMIDDVNGNKSSNLEDRKNRKSHKRKKELSEGEEDSSFESDSKVSNNANKDFSVLNSNSNPVSESNPEVSAKKKKKKKKKKCQEDGTSNNFVGAAGQNKSKLHHNKLKDRYKQHASEDKRLGLSDERLAAYGINPKKFKNKIMRSK